MRQPEREADRPWPRPDEPWQPVERPMAPPPQSETERIREHLGLVLVSIGNDLNRLEEQWEDLAIELRNLRAQRDKLGTILELDEPVLKRVLEAIGLGGQKHG